MITFCNFKFFFLIFDELLLKDLCLLYCLQLIIQQMYRLRQSWLSSSILLHSLAFDPSKQSFWTITLDAIFMLVDPLFLLLCNIQHLGHIIYLIMTQVKRYTPIQLRKVLLLLSHSGMTKTTMLVLAGTSALAMWGWLAEVLPLNCHTTHGTFQIPSYGLVYCQSNTQLHV